MRFLVLAAVLAACGPDVGVVHDGDTDIVLTAQYAEGDCGPRGDYVEIDWEIPDGAQDITLTLCDKEYADDTGGEQCRTDRPEGMTRYNMPDEPAMHDGHFWFTCGGYYPTTWRIDYIAPRP